MSTTKPPDIDLGQYKFGWHDPAHYVFEPKRGLNADVVREMGSQQMNGIEWNQALRAARVPIHNPPLLNRRPRRDFGPTAKKPQGGASAPR